MTKFSKLDNEAGEYGNNKVALISARKSKQLCQLSSVAIM